MNETNTVVDYNDETHEYKIDGTLVRSVTALAKQFSGMDTTWLQAHPEYAARGTLIHDELSHYFNNDIGYDDLTFDKARDIVNNMLNADINVDVCGSEAIVYNKEHGYAGTVDLFLIEDNKVTYILDFKSGNTRSPLYEQCQLSLYRLAFQSMGYDVEHTNLYIAAPNGVTEYDPLTWEQMSGLEHGDLQVRDETQQEIQRLEGILREYRKCYDLYVETEANLRKLLVQEFTDVGGKTYVDGMFKFQFAPASVRKSVDTKRLKDDGLYEQYIKETAVAPTVRVTKRNDDE